MKTPAFWYERHNILWALLLMPVSWLYALGRGVHCLLTSPRRVDGCFVICLGNFNAGGSGKTPASAALMELVKRAGLAKRPVFVMRGYGRESHGVVKVDLAVHDASAVGEEALMLARYGDVYVTDNRLTGIEAAKADGADLIIMDDGLQNRQVRADVNIAVIDRLMGIGNGFMIPAGPLREPLSWGRKRVDAAILIGGRGVSDYPFWPVAKPSFMAHISTDEAALPDKDKDYIAFAGIGYPRKFYTYLTQKLMLNVLDTNSFPDHHAYTRADVQRLMNRAKNHRATLITTEKDMHQLERLGIDVSEIKTVPITLNFEDQDTVVAFLQDKISP